VFAAAVSQRVGDLVEYRRHDQLDIYLPQMRLLAASSAMRSDLVNVHWQPGLPVGVSSPPASARRRRPDLDPHLTEGFLQRSIP
jgi:hypothetical protein